MTPPPSPFWWVIPAWRESTRLETFAETLWPQLAASGLPVTVQIVDDGSPPALAEPLAARCDHWRARWGFVAPLLRLPENIGKGGAIYAGWDHAPADTRWLGFCDADGSLAAAEVVRLLHLAHPTTTPTCLCASRHVPGARATWGSRRRFVLSHVYAAWVRAHTGLTLRDPQCGGKLLPASVFRSVRPSLMETRFAFDAELLLACQDAGATLREYPVRWHWCAGSRLHIGRDGWAMLMAMTKLRQRRRQLRRQRQT